MLGHIVCSEETEKKILESDIFRILQSEGVTEIGALYKVSPSKFELLFGSKTAKEKLQAYSSTDSWKPPIHISDWLIFCCGNLRLYQKKEIKMIKTQIL